MLTLDTSALIALMSERERHHSASVDVLRASDPPYIVPMGILAEVTYLALHRIGPSHLDRFLADIESMAYEVDCGDQDLGRVRELVRRYADLPLSFADACVVSCAERNGGVVCTFDRDFHIVAREGTISVLP